MTDSIDQARLSARRRAACEVEQRARVPWYSTLVTGVSGGIGGGGGGGLGFTGRQLAMRRLTISRRMTRFGTTKSRRPDLFPGWNPQHRDARRSRLITRSSLYVQPSELWYSIRAPEVEHCGGGHWSVAPELVHPLDRPAASTSAATEPTKRLLRCMRTSL